MRGIRAVFFLLVGLFFSACKEQQKSPRIVQSKGLPSELLLVVDKSVWESPVADTLKQIVEGPVPGLPQAEAFFRVTRILSDYYAQTYTTFHSKLFVKLDGSVVEPMLGVSYNVCARPQVELTVLAPSLPAMGQFLSRNGNYIRDVIADAQLDMRIERLRKKYNTKLCADVKSMFGKQMLAPVEIRASKRGDNFLWAGSNLNTKDLNVVLYSYPWDGSDVLQPFHFAEVRDSVMKINIPGSQPDQWMETSREDGLPLISSRLRVLDGALTQEVRGLWQMRHGALGGPFMALARVDTAARQVFVAEGFVYSPSTDKRDLLRSVEATIRTVK